MAEHALRNLFSITRPQSPADQFTHASLGKHRKPIEPAMNPDPIAAANVVRMSALLESRGLRLLCCKVPRLFNGNFVQRFGLRCGHKSGDLADYVMFA
jgi:hypothetical protein